MSLLNLDQLNSLRPDGGIDLEKYFRSMTDLSRNQQKERIELAKKIEAEVIWFLTLMSLRIEYDDIEGIETIKRQFVNEYTDIIQDYINDPMFEDLYPEQLADELARDTSKLEALERTAVELAEADSDSTRKNNLRSSITAVNEAQTVLNRADFKAAKAKGYSRKTWVSERDNRVRPTHQIVDGTTIPIDDLFEVGKARLLYPHDWLNGSANPEELINCRCVVRYVR